MKFAGFVIAFALTTTAALPSKASRPAGVLAGEARFFKKHPTGTVIHHRCTPGMDTTPSHRQAQGQVELLCGKVVVATVKNATLVPKESGKIVNATEQIYSTTYKGNTALLSQTENPM